MGLITIERPMEKIQKQLYTYKHNLNNVHKVYYEGAPQVNGSKITCSKLFNVYTAGSHYCCMAQDSLNGDPLSAHLEVHLEKHA